MNQQETTVLLSLIYQNEQLVALVCELQKELHDARARLDVCTGPVIMDTVDTTVPIHCWEGGVLRPDLGLGPDRGQPQADDPGGADADQPAAVRGAGVDGMDDYPGDSSYPVDPGRLHGAGGPGPGPEPGDRRGGTLEPGGDGAGDGPGRLGDGDAGSGCTHTAADVARLEAVLATSTELLAGPPVERRVCARCGRELPITAFRVRSGVCDDCQARKVPPATTRVCCDCGQEKPLAEFSRKAGSANPGGRRPFCQDCGKNRRAAGRRAQATKKAAESSVVVDVTAAPEAPPPAPVIPHKMCTRCNQRKPLSEFAAGYDGTIDGHDFLCSACREKATAERAKWAAPRRRAAALDGVAAS